MKTSVIKILVLISIISCSGGKRDEIDLFNGLSFKMEEGETLANIDFITSDMYTKYFNSGNIQAPLFRHIKHAGYDIFIGIPYNTSIVAMVEDQLERKDSAITSFRSDSLRYYKNYKRDAYYITEYAAKAANKSLIYICTMSNTKELADSLFNELKLSERIIQ